MPTEPSPEAGALARALAEAIAVLAEQGESGLEAFLATEPEHAPAIRRRLALLRDSGMLGQEPSERAPPEQLGEFVLGERLGSGGMGVVYAAEQPSLGRKVALKLIRPEHLYFPGARERFRREIEAIARLEHPGIVRVHCAGEEAGVPYYAMERVHGLSLDRLLDKMRQRRAEVRDERSVRELLAGDAEPAHRESGRGRGRRWHELCCRWICDLALAVDHAHRHGVLHRDLKPSNVVVTPDLSVKLLDFGLASTREASRLTRTGSQVGSLPYMAPEQIEGRNDAVDERTDVYALGVTMYELLTLQNPVLRSGESEEQTRRRILSGAVPAARTVDPAVSWDAETVCAVAMDPDPQRRYASAAELARDLDNALQLRPITARRPGPVRRLTRLARRRPAWAVGVLLGSLILFVGPTLFAIREGIAAARIRKANEEALAELQTKDGILEFLNQDLLAAVAPGEAGRDVPMRSVLDRAAQRIEGKFADRPHVEAAIRETIGHTYTLLGDLATAEPHLLRAVALGTEHHGPQHARTLESQRKLAQLYARQGRLNEAAALGAEVARACEATLGPEHEDTLTAKNNLGLVLLRQGRFDEAEPILRGVVDVRRRVLGDDHRHTLASMANLGLLYYDSGRPALAEPWWRLDLEGSRRTLPEDHPDLLVTLQNWANLQHLLGNQESSLELRRELAARTERVHGPRHRLTIERLIEVGYFEGKAGNFAAAEAQLRDALARCEELPPDHTTRVQARTTLALLQSKGGHPDEALRTIDATLAAMQASAESRPVQRERSELARIRILMDLRRWEDAEQQCARTAATIVAAQGSNSRLAEVKTLLGVCLHRLGRNEQAERMLLESAGLWQEHAPRHDSLREAHRTLVEVYEALGRPQDADARRGILNQWEADLVARKQE